MGEEKKTAGHAAAVWAGDFWNWTRPVLCARTDSSGRNGCNSCLIRARVRETLAIRGLLLVGDLSTTILTGGRILRKCCKGSYGAELRLKEMAFVDVTFSAFTSKAVVRCARCR
jgi:hypothetical protein